MTFSLDWRIKNLKWKPKLRNITELKFWYILLNLGLIFWHLAWITARLTRHCSRLITWIYRFGNAVIRCWKNQIPVYVSHDVQWIFDGIGGRQIKQTDHVRITGKADRAYFSWKISWKVENISNYGRHAGSRKIIYQAQKFQCMPDDHWRHCNNLDRWFRKI